jgi:PAS domain S-box-containing protein
VGGAIVSSLAGLLRITRRLKAQQAETLAVTLASIGDGVIVTDAQGRVTFINGEAERLTGWDSADAKGKPLTEVFRIVNEQTKAEMKKILGEITSGEFAKEWVDEYKNNKLKNFNALYEKDHDSQIEQVGRKLRKMMKWIKAKEI